MPPKDRTTNAQLRNKLGYNAGQQPAFIRALQARLSGKPDPTLHGGDDDGDWEQPDSSRPAIPRRPDAENERDDDDEEGDEAPTVVVLREGKHLSEHDVINEKRRLKGLPPLPAPKKQQDDEPSSSKSLSAAKDTADSTQTAKQTGVSLGARTTQKRKAPGDDSTASGSKTTDKKDKSDAKNGKTPSSQPKKKAKKESKNLLSFGDD